MDQQDNEQPDSAAPQAKTQPSLAWRFARVAGKTAKFSLKAVGIYLWPFAARWQRPFSRQGAKKKLVRSFRAAAALTGVLVAHQAVHTGTGLLFPTGEDYLKSQGLNPALAEKLSDRPIRVRERNAAGLIHAANDLPTIFGLATGVAMLGMEGQAYAIPGENTPGNIILQYTPLAQYTHCSVMTQGNVSARTTIAALGNISEGQIENIRISDRESQLMVVFHEFRHCDSHNRRLDGRVAEHDADVNGVLTLAKELKNPEIARTMLYARALGTIAHGHDTALYLDAAMNNRPLPESAAELTRPTEDAFDLASLYLRNRLDKDYSRGALHNNPTLTAYALTQVMKDYGELLSPTGQRRAELYIEAVQYFMPNAYARTVERMTNPAPATQFKL
jgi:hypothetical protein